MVEDKEYYKGLEYRISKIENNIDYAKFEVQEQRISELEEKLDFWKNQLIFVKKECFEKTDREIDKYAGEIRNAKQDIHELRDIIQKIGVKVDFTSQESGQALKDIHELKENCLGSYKRRLFERLRIQEEVLRDLSEGLFSYLGERMTLTEFLKILSNIFIEKLDGKDSEAMRDIKRNIFRPEERLK